LSKRFEEFLNQTAESKPEPEEGVTIYGGFTCEVCYYQCDEGIWNPTKRTLAWECPEGHKNLVKDFKGF
jgi:hypothetical protein